MSASGSIIWEQDAADEIDRMGPLQMIVVGATVRMQRREDRANRGGGATWFLGSAAFEVAGEQKEVKLTNQTHVAWNGELPRKDPTLESIY